MEDLKNEDKRWLWLPIQLISVLCISIGHFLDGTVLAYPSTAIPSLSTTSLFKDARLDLVRSFHSIGAILGCLLAGVMMNSLGRKGATIFGTIPSYMIGYVLIGSAQNPHMVVAGRLLSGIGLGLTLCIPTVYIVEISSKENRSTLGVLPNIFCQIGILATYTAGSFVDWRGLALAIIFTCIPFAIGAIWMPESPTFLVSRSQEKEAGLVMDRLRRHIWEDDWRPDPSEKLPGIKDSYKLIFTKPEYLKPMVTGIVLMAFFQTTGYPTLIGSTTELIRESVPNMSPVLANILIGVVLVLFALISIPVSRRFNSKVMLIISSLGVSTCLYIYGALSLFQQEEFLANRPWIPLAVFVLYIAFFMNGFGCVSWLIFAEILPPEIRPTAYPIGISFTWLFNFVMTFTFGDTKAAFGIYGVVWFYASCSFLAAIFIIICLPNTKNRTSKEIAEFYGKKRPDASSLTQNV